MKIKIKLIINGQIKEFELSPTGRTPVEAEPTGVRGIDFVGYRYFYGYTLLRKSTCKKFKRKVRQIKYKQDRCRPLTEREWAGINSYAGWLSRCDSCRLYEKYIQPYLSSIVGYYREFINERKYVSFGKRIFKLKGKH